MSVAILIFFRASLGIDMLMFHTINRISLFVLILSLGLQRDNPIVGINNIEPFMYFGIQS